MMMLGADVNLEESFLWHFESDSRFFLGHNTKAQMFHTYIYMWHILSEVGRKLSQQIVMMMGADEVIAKIIEI